jgi:hypothetical protein
LDEQLPQYCGSGSRQYFLSVRPFSSLLLVVDVFIR